MSVAGEELVHEWWSMPERRSTQLVPEHKANYIEIKDNHPRGTDYLCTFRYKNASEVSREIISAFMLPPLSR